MTAPSLAFPGPVRERSALRGFAVAIAVTLVALLLGGATTQGAAAAAEGEDCPDPRTCPHFAFMYPSDGPMGPGWRWEAGDDAIVHLPFYVNPTSALLSREDAVAAVVAATDAWGAYLPNVRFEFLGVTVQPARPDDGVNVVQLSGVTPMAIVGTDSGWIVEFDIQMNIPHHWSPCELEDDSCVPSCTELPEPVSGCYQQYELQGGLMHEIGHALGLGHAPSPSCELVMNAEVSGPGCTSNNRKRSTPGLGDILGAHALYPFTCPTDPAEQQSDRYRLVCPSIRIFYP